MSPAKNINPGHSPAIYPAGFFLVLTLPITGDAAEAGLMHELGLNEGCRKRWWSSWEVQKQGLGL